MHGKVRVAVIGSKIFFLCIMTDASETATNIVTYIQTEATEPVLLRELIGRGVCSFLGDEELSIQKLLGLEKTIIRKDLPIIGEGESETSIRVYWKKMSSITEVKKSYSMLKGTAIQPPSQRSRLPFISPAKSKNLSKEVDDSSLLNSTPRRKFVPPSNRVGTRLNKVHSMEDLNKEIEGLRKEKKEVEEDIEALSKEYSEEELPEHIAMLHEYNEVKDMGQLLLGKLAEVEGTTTTVLYHRFGLKLDS